MTLEDMDTRTDEPKQTPPWPWCVCSHHEQQASFTCSSIKIAGVFLGDFIQHNTDQYVLHNVKPRNPLFLFSCFFSADHSIYFTHLLQFLGMNAGRCCFLGCFCSQRKVEY